ncbi:UDP-glycosyltransferase [Gelidibacter salicanalis]|uniref:UDP-glycosyltransferase n=1 Tax=Gelidibacter salicanalis TaxID=291193 RepID=A0A934KTQ4_9FLAO|nr:UDP-glycosyltransferase [Gelidibacter salicanalis]MBJ7880578.1 UDP-glycosyltransferase [Gelidibacter salicanalis]
MTAKQRILIVAESIDVNDSSGSKANVALIKNLVTIGYNVSVLHYTRRLATIEGLGCTPIKERKFNVLYVLSRVRRLINRHFKIDIFKKVDAIFGFSFSFYNDSNSIAKAVKRHYSNEELIITLSKGASFRTHHAFLRLPNLHSKWMAYVHDPYPFHFYPRPYNWIEDGYRSKERFFKDVSEKAKYSVFPSLMLRDWMGSYFPNFIKTGIVIPHQHLFGHSEGDKKLPSYLKRNHFSILHAGNLMKQRPPNGLIEGFLLFLKKHPEALDNSQLIFLGGAPDHEQLLLDYASNISQLYYSQGNVPYDEAYIVQNNVSINVILESKSEISPFLPGKFPHCVLANKPILVLGPFYSESKRLLGENYPYWSEVDDIERIALLLGQLYDQWKIDKENLKLDRPDLEGFVSAKFLESQFQNIFRNVN